MIARFWLKSLFEPRVALAVALVAAAGLSSARYAERGLRHQREGYTSRYAAFTARLDPLRAHLPTGGTIGYLAQPDPTTDELVNAYRQSLIVYDLLPCRVEPAAEQELVLFDADDPQVEPAQARAGHWTLVAQGGAGMKLYRTVLGVHASQARATQVDEWNRLRASRVGR